MCIEQQTSDIPQDLKQCVGFHGHLCPGLTYGYLVAKEAIRLLEIKRSEDEEIVAIAENDSCAVDALQILLGTTAGKGNLILKDYGKNVYTILDRSSQKAIRFSRKTRCQIQTQDKILKSHQLLSTPFNEIFITEEIACSMPPYAPLAPSEPCVKCGEMTMSSKMKSDEHGKLFCIPCAAAL
jgi:formylmethanofuran dehydrogenase subunit E